MNDSKCQQKGRSLLEQSNTPTQLGLKNFFQYTIVHKLSSFRSKIFGYLGTRSRSLLRSKM